MPFIFGGFLVILLASGGASRPDEPHQVLARLAAIILIACGALALGREQLGRVRAPLFFLLCAVAVVAVQLVPMPPNLWAMLPGRDLYREGFAIAGLEPVWRPLSLTPDRTINALLALLPALAAVIGFAFLDREHYPLLVLGLILAILLAALIGIVQISSGSLYYYRVTNQGAAVGVFANRNHQAALLAAGFPLLAVWLAAPARDKSFEQLRSVLALVMATLLVAMVVATGSRAGLGLGAVSAILSLLLLWTAERHRRREGPAWRAQLKYLLPLVGGALAIAATLYWSRDMALQRLVGESGDYVRTALLPLFSQIARDFLPFGSGFGSFDPVFRSYEPYSNLGPNYINHVHNDYLEVVLEAGLLGAALLAIFLIWFVVRAWRLWAARIGRHDQAIVLGRAGSIIVLILLASSAVDYPLRTPTLAVVFTIAAIWMLPVGSAVRAAKTKLGSNGPIE